ncbi:MAG: hypothetical protein QM831_34235 [Kofleriaceae bacterium]
MKALFVAVALLVPGIARADQCELTDEATADKAIAVVKAHHTVLEYCEPCGDKAPGTPHVLDHVAKQRGVDSYYAVTLDKREVDLAYTYVEMSPGHFANLAKLAQCPTSGVTPELTVEQASDTGVLITPTPTPAPQATPAPQTIVIERSDSLSPWVIIVACIGSTGVWAMLLLLAERRRRARAMVPRAIQMVDRE